MGLGKGLVYDARYLGRKGGISLVVEAGVGNKHGYDVAAPVWQEDDAYVVVGNLYPLWRTVRRAGLVGHDNMLRQACMQFVYTRLSPCHVANQSLGARRGQQFPIGKATEHVCRSAGAAYVYALVVDVAVHILFSRGYGHGVYAGLLNGFGDGFYPACVVYEYVTGVVVAHRYSV